MTRNVGVLSASPNNVTAAAVSSYILSCFPYMYSFYRSPVHRDGASGFKARLTSHSLSLKSLYPNSFKTRHSPSFFLTAMAGRGIPLKVLFFTME